jgi:hypothetical protein
VRWPLRSAEWTSRRSRAAVCVRTVVGMRHPPAVVSALLLLLAAGCASLSFGACDDAELEAFAEIEHYVPVEPWPMNEGGCSGGFETTDSVVDVLDHYEAQLREAGWTIASRRIRTGADIDPMEPGGTVSADAVEGDLTASRGDLRAFLTYGKGNVPLQLDAQTDLAAVGITIARSSGPQ